MESSNKKEFKIVLLTSNPATKTSMFDKFDKLIKKLPDELFTDIDSLSSTCLEKESKELNRKSIARNMNNIKNATVIFYYIDKNINQSISLFLNSSKEIIDKTVFLLDFDPNKPNVDFSGFQYNMIYEFGLFVLNYSDTTSIFNILKQKIMEFNKNAKITEDTKDKQ